MLLLTAMSTLLLDNKISSRAVLEHIISLRNMNESHKTGQEHLVIFQPCI